MINGSAYVATGVNSPCPGPAAGPVLQPGRGSFRRMVLVSLAGAAALLAAMLLPRPPLAHAERGPTGLFGTGVVQAREATMESKVCWFDFQRRMHVWGWWSQGWWCMCMCVCFFIQLC